MTKANTFELLLMRMRVNALRKQIDRDLDAMLVQIENMIPEEKLMPNRRVKDWNQESNSWRKASK